MLDYVFFIVDLFKNFGIDLSLFNIKEFELLELEFSLAEFFIGDFDGMYLSFAY